MLRKSIGSRCGDRDHATVLHSIKVVENVYHTDKNFKKSVDDIERNFK